MYQSAFEKFSLKAKRVQELVDRPAADGTVMEAALLEMERARLAYAEARDALARELMPSLGAAARQREAAGVQGIAELLWQVAGRPEGTAHQDWVRAEEIARRAAA